VLSHSEEVRLIIGMMVQMWQLPDYQKLMRVYQKRLPETRQWHRECAQAIIARGLGTRFSGFTLMAVFLVSKSPDQPLMKC
jgi:hypothetical protein